MSTASLSKPRLERLHQVLSGYIQRSDMPGMVALVSCRDDEHVEVLGTMSQGDAAPMKRDNAAMILVLGMRVAQTVEIRNAATHFERAGRRMVLVLHPQ